MLYEDFCLHYHVVSYCRLVKTDGWISKSCYGEWIKDKTAGGPMNSSKFLTNPQYTVTSTSSCSISILLTQNEVVDGRMVDEREYISMYVFTSSVLSSDGHIKSTPRQKYLIKKCASFSNTRDTSLEIDVRVTYLFFCY